MKGFDDGVGRRGWATCWATVLLGGGVAIIVLFTRFWGSGVVIIVVFLRFWGSGVYIIVVLTMFWAVVLPESLFL